MISQLVSHYRIIGKLGEGGMGEVYLAEDTQSSSRKVAIKFLSASALTSEQAKKRFLREAQMVTTLNHPNICEVYEIGEESGRPFMVMQYIRGETLADRVQCARLNFNETLDVAVQITKAVAEAHSNGILHRDIKPQNIMITTEGEVKVLDFGLAKVAPAVAVGEVIGETQSLITEQGTLIGTVPYMSPEQVRSEILDHRSDIFSLGTIIYRLFSGKHPFEGATPVATIAAILTHEPAPMATKQDEAQSRLERVVSKCLEKNRDKRYSSAEELLQDLYALRRGHSLVKTAERPPTAKNFIRRRAVLALLALAVVSLIGLMVYFRSPAQGIDAAPLVHSIAVLPFAGADAKDIEADSVSQGLTDSLINNLSRLPGVKVIARNSVFKYANQEINPLTVGRALNAEALLTGKVRQDADSLIITVNLVDARNGRRIWGEQYERKQADILAVQSEIIHTITEQLRLKLKPEQKQRLIVQQTDNLAAYKLYLKGRYFWNKRTPEDLQKGIAYFQQAINLDPAYALAYAGLADSYSSLGGGLHFLSPKDSMPMAKAASVRALELDGTLAEAHTSLAIVLLTYDWQWETAETEFKRAIELNPNSATAHNWYAYYLISMGRLNESIAESKLAQELDPLSLFTSVNVSRTLYYARQYDQTIENCKKILALDSNFVGAHYLLGLAYAKKGMYADSLESFQKVKAIYKDNPLGSSALGYAYAISGNRAEAVKIIDDLKEKSTRRYVSPANIAIIYIALKDNDKAIEWLEKAYEQRVGVLIYLKVEPSYDDIRVDPKFKNLLQRIGLERWDTLSS